MEEEKARRRPQSAGMSRGGGWGGGGALLLPCVTMLAMMLPHQGEAVPLNPSWQWDVGLTRDLSGQVGAVTRLPMPHYACTKVPDYTYCPGCLDFKGANCEYSDFGLGCQTCNDMCEPFDMGLGTFPAACLPRLQTLEGRASPLATFLHHRVDTPNAQGGVDTVTYPPTVGPGGLVDPFSISATVRWGYLDVGNYLSLCTCAELAPCQCGPLTDTTFGTVSLQTNGAILEEQRTVVVTGTFLQIYNAMRNMSFTPLPLQNSLRVRHARLSPTSTRIQPWFQVDYRINAPLSDPPTFSQIIHVIAVNDPPTVTDPQEGYVPGCITQTPCNTIFSIIESTGPNFHFGQYWRYEGSSDPLMITGIEVADPDVDELCLFQETKPTSYLVSPLTAYFCGLLDFSARALIGTITLNKRDDLFFYDDSRQSTGFTATVDFLQQAVRAIFYRVDTPELISSGQSSSLRLNTQYEGAVQEYINILVSDQGLVGAMGVAQTARDKNGKPGLRLNVTIVAVNNAPTLKNPTDFSVNEDEPRVISGLDVDDIDSEEVTRSSLAFEDWLGKRSNQRYLNRVRMTLELRGFSNGKGRGFIYLSPDAREISIVSNGSQVFVSIESLFPGHDACAFRPLINRPGVSRCSPPTTPSRRGALCSDDTFCSFVGEGAAAPANNRTIVLTARDVERDALVRSAASAADFRLTVTNGTNAGFSSLLSGYVEDGLGNVTALQLVGQMPAPPDATTRWRLARVVNGGACAYAGIELQKVCAHWETTPELNTRFLSSCEAGKEANCTCRMQDTCQADGRMLLFLNRSKSADIAQYIEELTDVLAGTLRTCGALPLLRQPYPLNSSYGRPCTTNASCQDDVFPKCVPGQTCKCCGNASVTCAANADCAQYGVGGSTLCGCTEGLEPPTLLQEHGARCCANLTERCSTNADCDVYLAGSRCGCVPGGAICGPLTHSTNPVLPPNPGYGRPCVYRGVLLRRFDDVLQQDEVTMYGSSSCEAPMFVYEGTRNQRVFNQLVLFPNEFQAGTLAAGGRGSTRIEFYASLVFCKLTLQGIQYLTYNPEFPKYNRKYRIPEEDRDPTTFRIGNNDFDVLHLTANDMGNSGGGARDIKEATTSFQIVVAAVNNPPEVNAPVTVTVQEDVPFSIINKPAEGRYGINITDPDQTNFGFNDPRFVTVGRTTVTKGFEVNLTVQHGCLFLDEKFLQFGPEYAARAPNRAVVGGADCDLSLGFDRDPPGCTIRLKDYGQPRMGLHAVQCADQAVCTENAGISPCYSEDTTVNKPHCYGRMCTKTISFEGRFPDVNAALSNVTYLSDYDFNTYYGFDETLRISVSDNGMLGDAVDTPSYFAERTINIIVQPVNDPPTLGRLVEAPCVNLGDDGSVSLTDVFAEDRLFSISPNIDFVDVDEDTVFTILPDRLWIADVDSEEAEIRSSRILQCAGECGSVAPAPQGCCRDAVCPQLCEKIREAALGALPSRVLIEFKVDQGLISFYPPPTRALLSGLEFMTNLTLTDIKSGGEIKPCDVQAACMRNQTKIWVRARMSVVQEALRQGFLTYQGAPYWHGSDSLQVWVSDDGYTDVNFTTPLATSTRLPITVVPVNNAPTVSYPGGQGCACSAMTGTCECERVPPLLFTKGLPCENDWTKYSFLDPWPEGRALICNAPNESSVPNQKVQYEGFPALSQNLVFGDIDMNDAPNGNMTVEIMINRRNAGSFTIRTISQTVSYFQWVDDDEMLHIRLKGRMPELNQQMGELYYSANDDYSGPAPFIITVSDNNNYGICTPNPSKTYTCERSRCLSIRSPANLNNNFLCGMPLLDQLQLLTFFQGGATPCLDIRTLGEPINPFKGGLWSGPFSCLGCGYYVASERTVISTNEDNPSIPGLSRVIVDTVVGGAAACEYSNCSECNRAPRAASGDNGDGCGWCPSFCEGRGKCMIGRQEPTFETCPPDPTTGLMYRQCAPQTLNLPLIIGLVIPMVLLVVFLAYTFYRWVRRRHGNFRAYIKKKRFDMFYTGQRLKILPPPGARYTEFFYMAIISLVAALLLSGAFESIGGPFSFSQEIYLDLVTSINLDLDNCQVRFLPTRNFPYPTSAINAIKLRFSIPDDPAIRLRSDTCRSDATFRLENSRFPAATKYINYYCFVQILVPDAYVMPRVTINAIGENVTTVRSGPMDEDTPNFGLEFGPNEFVMTGDTMIARIENVSAKHLKYEVNHGSLTATDVTFTTFGTFSTIDADIVVTTDAQTTVRYWQKSDNLVCLSAPTLFLDSSCQDVCDYVPLDDVAADANATVADFRDIDRVYRRRNLLQTCDLTPGNPLYVPGCVTDSCEIAATPQCTCKKTCDMVEPAALDFNGVSGIAGRCDTEGRCCREICGGYSTADMFPHDNTVRCGLCQDQNECTLPRCGPWTPGRLDQQWWFTSERGQISVSVQNKELLPRQLHSYKSSTPAYDITVQPDFAAEGKRTLNEVFHPGGAPGPIEEWFWLRVTGPGSPPRTLGTFVWLRSKRYIILPDYFLNVVSFGQLNPKKKAGGINLNPGYCPTFVDADSSEMRRRIIELRGLLSDTLEYYPPDVPANPFEIGALIVWIPVQGEPSEFVLDQKTNQFGLSPIAQYTGGSEVLTIIVIFSFLVPFAFATTIIVFGSLATFQWIKKYRQRALVEENVILNLLEQARIREMDEFNKIEAETIPQAKQREMKGRTNLWHMLETTVMDPQQAKTLTVQFATVVGHVLVIAAPILYIKAMADQWKQAYQGYFCENRVDQDVCYAEIEPLSLSVFWILLVFSIMCLFDLAFHYLNIPYSRFREHFRTVFYVFYVIVLWCAFFLVFLSAVWIYLGALQTPKKLGQYCLVPILIIGIVVKYFQKQRRFQLRVKRKISERLRHFEAKMAKKQFPENVLKILLEKNVETALNVHGVSNGRIFVKCLLLLFLLVVIYAYVFIGFQAFTDPTSAEAAVLNLSIVLSVALGFFLVVRGDGDREWASEQTELMADDVMETMEKVLHAIRSQLRMATKLMKENGMRIDNGFDGEWDEPAETDALLGGGPSKDMGAGVGNLSFDSDTPSTPISSEAGLEVAVVR